MCSVPRCRKRLEGTVRFLFFPFFPHVAVRTEACIFFFLNTKKMRERLGIPFHPPLSPPLPFFFSPFWPFEGEFSSFPWREKICIKALFLSPFFLSLAQESPILCVPHPCPFFPAGKTKVRSSPRRNPPFPTPNKKIQTFPFLRAGSNSDINYIFPPFLRFLPFFSRYPPFSFFPLSEY